MFLQGTMILVLENGQTYTVNTCNLRKVIKLPPVFVNLVLMRLPYLLRRGNKFRSKQIVRYSSLRTILTPNGETSPYENFFL